MRTAVIIGATSGIGRAVAEKLLREGWRVVVTGRRVEALERIRGEHAQGSMTMGSPVQVAVVSSVAGTKGLGTAPAYSATKKMQSTYVSALSQLARMEKLPVEFTDIRPGFVTTEILDPDKHYPMAISARKAAEYIVKGLKRRRRVIVFDWRFRTIVFLWRLIPDFIWERITIVKN